MMPIHVRRRALLPLAAVAFCLACTGAAAAGSGPSPEVMVKVQQASGVASSYFDVQARRGAVARAGVLELFNPAAKSIAVSLDPVDSATAGTLGSTYELTGHASSPWTGWLRLSARRIVLPPHGQANVRVTADVPRSAAPGDYLSGIAVEALHQKQQVSVSHQLAISEVYRYAIGVELSLPGARHPLVRFTGARLHREPSGLTFYLLARNRGNVILKGVHGWATVTRGKHVVASVQIAPGTFVSATDITYPILTRTEHPPEGTAYRVRAALYYAGGVAYLDTSVTFGHAAAVIQQQYGGPKLPHGFDWWWIAVAAAAVALAIYALWRRRRPLTRAKALALLRRELGAARVPLSLVHIGLGNASRATRRRVASSLRPRMRKSDRLCDLGDDGLMVLLPDTNPTMAGGLASDISSTVRRAQLEASVDGIGTATAFDHVDPLELIERARARERVPTIGGP